MTPNSFNTPRVEAASESEPSADCFTRAVLRTLLYYDLFDFPLKLDEVFRLSETRWPDHTALEASVQALVDQGLVCHDGQWIHLNKPGLVEQRIKAEARAARVMPRALRRSKLIGRFPFVRGVALSGTISKGVFAKGDDVDFFVITAPGRLWICRVLLMGFKKIFLFNSRRTFCINYLVTEDHLEVPDHNLFTATEIAWLVPTMNPIVFEQFFDINNWVGDFLPNLNAVPSCKAKPWRPFAPSRIFERFLLGKHGDHLDDRCRSVVERHNLRRYNHIEPKEFDLALRTAKNVSKHHPQSLQARILKRFGASLEEFEARHGVVLK